MQIFLVILAALIVSGLIGSAIGKGKDRGIEGFWLGFLLGWIGWIIVAVMRPTVENEAHRTLAVAKEVGRMTGHGGQPAAARQAGLLDTVARSNMAPLVSAAGQDPQSTTLMPAVDAFARIVAPPRPLLGWFFCDGAYQLVVAYDGILSLCNATDCRTVYGRADRAYDVDESGAVVAVTIDGITLTNVRPGAVVGLLGRAARVRIVIPAKPPAAVSSQSAEQPVAALQLSVADALRHLDELRTAGLVSDDEYQTKRVEILSRL